jgi:hypothetical protein
MPIGFVSGQVIYHHWGEDRRLIESTRAFRSLDELLMHCLAPPEKRVVARISVTGQDAQGRRRQVVLSFQSVTEPQ